ncbi:MAG: SGNH/GDSL hydrolase family protein [Vibrio sp.]
MTRWISLWLLMLFSATASSNTLLILGDSLSAGYAMPIEQAWPSLLSEALGEKGQALSVVNASISGDTTGNGLERLIRMDDWEMNPDTQAQVAACLTQLNANNFQQLGDYTGFKQEFMQLNGFGFTEIDYQQPVNLGKFIRQNTPS